MNVEELADLLQLINRYQKTRGKFDNFKEAMRGVADLRGIGLEVYDIDAVSFKLSTPFDSDILIGFSALIDANDKFTGQITFQRFVGGEAQKEESPFWSLMFDEEGKAAENIYGEVPGGYYQIDQIDSVGDIIIDLFKRYKEKHFQKLNDAIKTTPL